MKKFVLLTIIFMSIGYWFKYKSNKNNFNEILPEKTVFFVDPVLSKSMQCHIIQKLETLYVRSKNPEQVITSSNVEFPEIESMKVQICQSDKICFYIEAAKPLFVLNFVKVVSDNGKIIDCDHFDPSILNLLVSVFAKNSIDVVDIIYFVKNLPEIFRQEFDIDFRSKNEIHLIDKKNKNFVLEASIYIVPTLQDLYDCRKIAEEVAAKSKFKKKVITCDVRFKNQIIVR